MNSFSPSVSAAFSRLPPCSPDFHPLKAFHTRYLVKKGMSKMDCSSRCSRANWATVSNVDASSRTSRAPGAPSTSTW